jgi:lipopolysaccharide/colanic/teichoic acid biosynthesis glycosyltransferase
MNIESDIICLAEIKNEAYFRDKILKRCRYILFRRFLEIFSVVLLSPILILLILLISIPVFLCFKGKIFYIQTRAGCYGVPFNIYKFRTMNDLPGEKSDIFTHPKERITSFGSFLRRHRIDELPQIWNVLKGDMSFIGPRPEINELYQYFSDKIENYKLRKFIPQGISGWAQINYPHTVTLEGNIKKLNFDLYYINNLSFFMDVKIFFKTIVYVINGKNSN